MEPGIQGRLNNENLVVKNSLTYGTISTYVLIGVDITGVTRIKIA